MNGYCSEGVENLPQGTRLSFRNFSKDDRDELIRRLAASGHKQKEIAEAVGLTRSGVANIISAGVQKGQAPDFTNSELTTTQRLKDELAGHATDCTTDRLFLSFR